MEKLRVPNTAAHSKTAMQLIYKLLCIPPIFHAYIFSP
jgi:hypothetical protein